VKSKNLSFISVLLESDKNVETPQLTENDIINLMNKNLTGSEDLILATSVRSNLFMSLFPVAVNRGYIKFAKKLYEVFLQENPNTDGQTLQLVEKVDYLDVACLDRLYKDVGFPMTEELIDLLAGYPTVTRLVPFHQALYRYNRSGAHTCESRNEHVKALKVFDHVLQNYDHVPISSHAVSFAVLSQNRRLVELLLKERAPITSEALHTAFFQRKHDLLTCLMDHFEKNIKSISATSPPLTPINNEDFSMPYPVKPSDDHFYHTFRSLVQFGVYDLDVWRRQVIQDALYNEHRIGEGVVADLISTGHAQVTSETVRFSSYLSDEDFNLLFKQTISREEIDDMSYLSVFPNMNRAKVLRSAGVPVASRCLREMAFVWGYEEDEDMGERYQSFTEILSWYAADNALPRELGSLWYQDDEDALFMISRLLNTYEIVQSQYPDRYTNEEDKKTMVMAFEQLLQCGFPVTQGEVTLAGEQGWTDLAELFRSHVTA
jgi:hypothetical protein